MKPIAWLAIIAALGAGGWYVASASQTPEPAAAYRTVAVTRGDIIAQVSTAGTVAPITTVIVGSQLSGQVVEILADYNSEVKAGQVLARLNSDQIRARLDAARAELSAARASRQMLDAQLEKSKADAARADAVAADMRAQLMRVETQVADAEKTFARNTDLSSQGITTGTALQAARTQRDTLLAQRQSALAQIEQANAQKLALLADQKILTAQMASADAQALQRAAVVRQIEVDLGNTDIRAPVAGVVIQRNVELGQPVAASLQAPTLFLVAQDLRRVQIQANVDEADVGRVSEGQSVSFTVNAYPGRTFEGSVRQVRLGSQTVQNVVIYTTVIDVDNARLELKPGMTANLRILTDRRANTLRVPNAALRWRPPAVPEAPAALAVAAAAAQQQQQGEGTRPADPDAAGPFTAAAGGRGGRGLFIERLKAELELTPGQRTALDRLLQEMPDQGRTGGPGGGGRQAREAFAEKVNALLTDEQKIRFAAIQERAQQGRAAAQGGRTGEGRRNRDGAAAPERRAIVTGRVYRLAQNGEAVGVTVELGATDGAFTEIVSGLSEADRLIVGGGAPPKRSGFRFGI